MDDKKPELEFKTYVRPEDEPAITTHGLAYPGFSVVFLHTFSLPDMLELYLPVKADEKPAEGKDTKKEKTPTVSDPLIYMDQRIEKMMFVSQKDNDQLRHLDYHKPFSRKQRLERPMIVKSAPVSETVSPVRIFNDDSVCRFAMNGFDFHMPIRSKKDTNGEYDFSPVDLEGHVNVEVSLFFGNTVSVAYKFYFNGKNACILDPLDRYEEGKPSECDASTDHIIALVSSFLSAEYWTAEDNGDGDINLKKRFVAKKFWLDKDGDIIENEKDHKDVPLEGPGRVFDEILMRYKKYLYKHHTAYSEKTTREQMDEEEAKLKEDKQDTPDVNKHDRYSVENDNHYAMVDIWETVKHVETDEDDPTEYNLFSRGRPEKLTEAEMVRHIKEHHKAELIGLMTLYPCEWPYREDEAYADVCGDSIAIDSDDLVLVGSHMAVVIGTYGRRGSESPGVDWKSVLANRDKYHVAWPEFLLILQFVLAKKHIVSMMKEKMIELALEFKRGDTEEDLSGKNSDFMLDVSRQLLQLDIVKYARFASHRVMYDRTMKRLNLEHDLQSVREISDMLNDNIQNISDHRAVKSDHLLNGVLLAMSIMAGCELLFQDSRFDFASELLHIDGPWNTMVAAVLIAAIAVVIFFGFTLLIKKYIQPYFKMRRRKKKNRLQ